ncbi:MAG: LysE family translocator [Gammaproteobacteria bacterium]|nr:LysE family translocator [Gammaproteobacteria bacterium]
MIDTFALLSSGLAFFVVAVTPGPANLSNAAIAMKHGRRISLIYGAGLSTGLVFWGIVAASGMGAVLQSSLYVLMVLKLLGGAYLLWLAFQSARATWSPNSSADLSVKGHRWFIKGLVLNLSNPKSVLAWMAALSVGLGPNTGLSLLISATMVCICVGFINNALYSICFSMTGMMRLYVRCSHWINGIASVLFAAAGFSLIRSALSRQ